MAFILDPQTEKITFGVVSDGTHDGIARAIADIFGASESFKDDFSTYLDQTEADTAWVPQDSPDNVVNITNDNYDFTVKRNGINTATTFDLGAGNVNNTQWVLRAKVNISSLIFTTGVGTGAGISVGISDTDSSTGQLSVNNSIAMALTNAQTGGGQAQHVSADTLSGTITSTAGSTSAFSALETIYVEVKRLSTTSMQTTIYTDANYTVIRDSVTRTISVGLTGLRFIRFDTPDDNVPAFNGTLTGNIDDIQFWDGVTEPSITDNDWRLRFELDITNLDDGANATDKRLYMLMTDEDETSDSNNPQDSLGLLLRTDNAITNFFNNRHKRHITN